jgi:hypothetical protein
LLVAGAEVRHIHDGVSGSATACSAAAMNDWPSGSRRSSEV